ncbi:MAG: hypothetical protein KGL39_12185 [Patescibacteria group bacterium]|nr:hypothetical protein [Patescibacteria group bacterium]
MSTVACILRPRNPRYLARVRASGERKMTPLGRPSRSQRVAARRMAEAMADDFHWRHGDVLRITDDYYDPAVVLRAEQ